MLKKTEHVIRTHDMLPVGSRVLCAVSGGADSVCLLAVLYGLREKLNFTLCAGHYNHCLRGEESDRDENFVRELIASRFPGVELYVGRGDVAARAEKQGTGLEETAREMRYAFLQEQARTLSADAIATAHTADDNAETVLLHLARGTGLQGLCGIAPVKGNIIRPLLTTTRREVEDYLAQHKLSFVEDSTNSDDYYARNRVRHQVMPVLEGLYPGFARRLTENGGHLRADEVFLSAQAEELLKHLREEPGSVVIPAAVLARAGEPVAIRAIRRMFSQLREGDDTCSAAHLQAVLELCRSSDPSGECHLPGGIIALREYEMLKLLRPAPGESWDVKMIPCIYQGQAHTGLELWLSREKAPRLTVRTRREGDGLKLPGRHSKSLKKWLIDLKIPRRERDFLPVLAVDDRVAAAAQVGPDIDFIPVPGEEAWQIVFVRPGGQTGKEL